MAELLRQRFAVLANPLDDSDWVDVRRRAGVTRRRRPVWIAFAAVLIVIAVLLATPAAGLRGRIVQLFEESEPAPRSVIVQFASLEVGAPSGMAPGVIPEEAKRVRAFRLRDGEEITLWVAPTRTGGFCGLWTNRFSGCVPAKGAAIAPSLVDIPPKLIAGSVRTGGEVSLQLEFQDGDILALPVTWVSAPIDAGFFLYEVPESRREEGQLPVALVLRGPDGESVAREQLRVLAEVPDFPQPTGERRRLIEIITEKGVKAAIVVAPGENGASCRWLVHGRSELGGGCWSRPLPRSVTWGISQGGGRGRRFVLLEGEVPAASSTVELRFEDGEVVRIKPVEGSYLYDVPSAHFLPGHRLKLIVALDSQSREIARKRIDTTTQGMYPCDEPIDAGYGLEICP